MNVFDLVGNRPFVASVLMHFVLFLLLYVMIRLCVLIISKKGFNHEVRYFIGMIYFAFVLALTMTPLNFTLDWASIASRIQLVPFDTVTRFLPMDGEYSIYNIAGNIIMMLPILPILTTCFKIGTFKQATLFTAVFILCIEVGQLFFTTSRVFDVDDFILNMIGFFISALIWQILKSVKIVK